MFEKWGGNAMHQRIIKEKALFFFFFGPHGLKTNSRFGLINLYVNGK